MRDHTGPTVEDRRSYSILVNCDWEPMHGRATISIDAGAGLIDVCDDCAHILYVGLAHKLHAEREATQQGAEALREIARKLSVNAMADEADASIGELARRADEMALSVSELREHNDKIANFMQGLADLPARLDLLEDRTRAQRATATIRAETRLSTLEGAKRATATMLVDLATRVKELENRVTAAALVSCSVKTVMALEDRVTVLEGAQRVDDDLRVDMGTHLDALKDALLSLTRRIDELEEFEKEIRHN